MGIVNCSVFVKDKSLLSALHATSSECEVDRKASGCSSKFCSNREFSEGASLVLPTEEGGKAMLFNLTKILSLCCFVFCLSNCDKCFGDESMAQSLLADALKYRLEATKGCFEINIVTEISGRGVPRKMTRRLWFDDSHLRQDCLFRNGQGEIPEAYRESRAQAQGIVKFYTDAVTSDGGRLISYIKNAVNGNEEKSGDLFFDPRLLGMAPCSVANLTHYALESIWPPPGDASFEYSVDEVDHHGVACKLIVYKNALFENRAYLDPSRGMQPLEVTLSREGEIETVETDLVSAFGFWMPGKLHYRWINNGTLVRDETADVSVISINQSFDDGVFDFIEMGAPIGTIVYDKTSKNGSPFVLSSEGLLRMTDSPVEHSQIDLSEQLPHRGHYVRWLLIGNVIACLFIVLSILWWRR